MPTGAKDPAFAGSVSLDETRERDVLAPSRLALAAFLRQALMQSPLWEIKAPQREEPRPWPGHPLLRVALQLARRLR